jgi:hypothetical protein
MTATWELETAPTAAPKAGRILKRTRAVRGGEISRFAGRMAQSPASRLRHTALVQERERSEASAARAIAVYGREPARHRFPRMATHLRGSR